MGPFCHCKNPMSCVAAVRTPFARWATESASGRVIDATIWQVGGGREMARYGDLPSGYVKIAIENGHL